MLGGGMPRDSYESPHADNAPPKVIFVVSSDDQVRRMLIAAWKPGRSLVEEYSTCESFLATYQPHEDSCLLVDACLLGTGELEMLQILKREDHHLPCLVITSKKDFPTAIRSLKFTTSDFVRKPISRPELLARIERVMCISRAHDKLVAWREAAAIHLSALTKRQLEIMAMMLAGHPSKNIAMDLGIALRTVEKHRASIMKRTGSRSLPALARLALTAGAPVSVDG
jgi:two-component system, chemotaxis family, CheB/CheR fusion protein